MGTDSSRGLRRALSFGTLCALVSVTTFAHANPIAHVPDQFGTENHEELLLFIIGASLGVEYLLVRLLLGSTAPIAAQVQVFFFANAITIVPTQVIARNVGAFAEVVPLLIEPAIYGMCLANPGIFRGRLFLAVVAANVGSYLIGLAAYHGLALLRPVA